MRAGVGAGPQFGRRAWFHWVWRKYFAGRGAETEAHVYEALRLSPRDIFAYRWLLIAGFAKLQLGDDAEAVSWLRRSIEANRNYSCRSYFSRRCLSAARFAGSGEGRSKGGTCTRSKLHHPPLPRWRIDRQSDLSRRTRAHL